MEAIASGTADLSSFGGGSDRIYFYISASICILQRDLINYYYLFMQLRMFILPRLSII